MEQSPLSLRSARVTKNAKKAAATRTGVAKKATAKRAGRDEEDHQTRPRIELTRRALPPAGTACGAQSLPVVVLEDHRPDAQRT